MAYTYDATITASDTLRGGASGAAMGASVGSAIPGVGTAIGAGIGFVGGAIYGGLASGKQQRDEQDRKKKDDWRKMVEREERANAVARMRARAAHDADDHLLMSSMGSGGTMSDAWTARAYGG